MHPQKDRSPQLPTKGDPKNETYMFIPPIITPAVTPEDLGRVSAAFAWENEINSGVFSSAKEA